MTKLLLHIGFPKTGTTAIQQRLSSSRRQLGDSGILYPTTGSAPKGQAHHGFAYAIARGDKRECEELRTRLLEEMGAGAFETIVLSSEAFVVEAQPDAVREFFEGVFTDVRAVVFLRNTLAWLESDYNQGVKGLRRLTASFDEHAETMVIGGALNYTDPVMRWQDCFGRDRVVLRSYDWNKENLLGALLETVGASGVGLEPATSTVSNPKLSAVDLEVVRFLNSLGTHWDDHRRLVKQMRQEADQTKSSDDVDLFANLPRRIKRMCRRVAARNRRLNPHFFSAERGEGLQVEEPADRSGPRSRHDHELIATRLATLLMARNRVAETQRQE